MVVKLSPGAICATHPPFGGCQKPAAPRVSGILKHETGKWDSSARGYVQRWFPTQLRQNSTYFDTPHITANIRFRWPVCRFFEFIGPDDPVPFSHGCDAVVDGSRASGGSARDSGFSSGSVVMRVVSAMELFASAGSLTYGAFRFLDF